MNIEMIGVDHTIASIDDRQIFSFTKTQQKEAMREACAVEGITGCVIIATCNRMELYISTKGETEINLLGLLCRIKNVPPGNYESLLLTRSGADAAKHLFSLSAGMESRIIGEDQILMQVKEALSWAREWDTADKVLEVLFRMAVTVGKRVRTEIRFSRENSSAIHGALMQLRQMGYAFENKRCLVIGNGHMGKLTANALRDMGAEVTVTVRQYRSGVVEIPKGCACIHYGERYHMIPESHYIVSATTSPNMTLIKEEIAALDLSGTCGRTGSKGNNGSKVFIDLAVPRDIDPAIGELEGAVVFDIDSFAVEKESEEMKAQMAEAEKLMEETLDEFVSWYECRDFVPLIKKISHEAAKDTSWRMGQTFQKMHIENDERRQLENAVEKTSQKVVQKLMFELRDQVNIDTLRECLEAFMGAYPEVKSG